jgi:hypothetical protein
LSESLRGSCQASAMARWGAGDAIWRWEGERRQIARMLHGDLVGVVGDRVAVPAFVLHAQVVSFGQEPEGFGRPIEAFVSPENAGDNGLELIGPALAVIARESLIDKASSITKAGAR